MVHEVDRSTAYLYNFSIESARLTPPHIGWLDKKIAELRLQREKTWTIWLHGTASRTGAADYNQGLAWRRAESVKRYLEQHLKGIKVAILPFATGEFHEFMTPEDNTEDSFSRAVQVRIVPIAVQQGIQPPPIRRPTQRRPPFKEKPQPVRAFEYQVVARTFAPFKVFGVLFEGDDRQFSTSSSVTYRTGAFLVFNVRTGAITSGPTADSTGSVAGGVRLFSKVKAVLKEKHGDKDRIFLHMSLSGSVPHVPGAPDIDTDVILTAFMADGKLYLAGEVIGQSFPNTEVFVRDHVSNGHFLVTHATPGGAHSGPLSRLFGPGLTKLGSFKEAITLDGTGAFIGSARWDK